MCKKNIERKGYGPISFEEKWIRNGLKYVSKNSNEVAAIIAVPQILKRGVEIAHDPNHKNRGFSTTTFAGPVILNGKRGNMAVVVKETSPYHYDVHRILTPDGKAFAIPEYKNAEPTMAEAKSKEKILVVTPISSASDDRIADNGKSVNPSDKKTIKRDVKIATDAAYLKAVESGEMETAQKMVEETAQKAMPDSAVVDDSGNLLYMYHGTSTGGFTVFDPYSSNFGLFGQGLYFTENEDVAKSYTAKGKGASKQVYKVFLNIENPLDMDADADIAKWKTAFKNADADVSYLDDAVTNEDAFKALVEYLTDEGYYKSEAYEVVHSALTGMGYDGITHIGGGRYNANDKTRHRVYIAFEAEQVKSAEPVTYDNNGNVIPLSERFDESNPDIRYDKKVPDSSYEAQVDKVKANTHDPNNHVYMGTTPVRLVNILGLPKLPMLITPNHVYSVAVSEQEAKQNKRYHKGTHYHGLGWDTVKKMPEYIGDAALIIKSNTDPDDVRFVVVTNQVDGDGNPIFAAIKPNGESKYFGIDIASTAMLSSYGKENFRNYIAKAKTENRILYVDKKRSHTKKNGPGLYLSNAILLVDFDKSLSQFREIVKNKFQGTMFANNAGSDAIKFDKKVSQDSEAGNEAKRKKAVKRLVDSSPAAEKRRAQKAEAARRIMEQQESDDMTTPYFESQSTMKKHQETVDAFAQQRAANRSGITRAQAVEQYGEIEQGEKPQRTVSVPKRIDNKTKVSKLVRTAMEAKVTPDEAMPMFEDSIMDGLFSYKPEKNSEMLRQAEQKFDGKRSTTYAFNAFLEKSGKGKLRKEDGILMHP